MKNLTIDNVELRKNFRAQGRSLLMEKHERQVTDKIQETSYKNKYESLYNHLNSVYRGMKRREELVKEETHIMAKLFVEAIIEDMKLTIIKYMREMINIENRILLSYINSTVYFTEKDPNWNIPVEIFNDKFKFLVLNCNLIEDGRTDLCFYDLGHVFYNGMISVKFEDAYNIWRDFSFSIMKATKGKYLSNDEDKAFNPVDSAYLRNRYKTDQELLDIIYDSVNIEEVIITLSIDLGSGKFKHSVFRSMNFDDTSSIYDKIFIDELVGFCKELYECDIYDN
jgi:hypothetical protein